MNNKKQYEEPKVQIVVLETEDIITTSGDKDIEMEEIDDW